MNSKKYWKKYLRENSNLPPKKQGKTTRTTVINKRELFRSITCIILSLLAIIFFVIGLATSEPLSYYFYGGSPLFILIVEFFYARRIFSGFVTFDGDDFGIIGMLVMVLLSPIIIPVLIIISIKNIINQYRGIDMSEEDDEFE